MSADTLPVEKRMPHILPTAVQMQFMRPGQLEAAARQFPVVYVPFGLIEWHGRHLPLGNDALKAHGILVKCAERYGGVVYPPVFFPHAIHNAQTGRLIEADRGWKLAMVTALFEGLKKTGFRVIIGVSGHNIQTQLELIDEALKPVVADGTLTGMGLWEMSLSRCAESDSDHAAKWETSNMMFFYPDLVDMSLLGTGPLAPAMKPPDGIGGLDPRQHASAEAGGRNAELAAKAIGEKAKELLLSLPEDKRSFNLQAVSPEHWWLI
ncbi:MAG: creatininase family protein [Lentisphaerae bacterium]|nr:creatininase family protein [Lentisphaerota bacterium]